MRLESFDTEQIPLLLSSAFRDLSHLCQHIDQIWHPACVSTSLYLMRRDVIPSARSPNVPDVQRQNDVIPRLCRVHQHCVRKWWITDRNTNPVYKICLALFSDAAAFVDGWGRYGTELMLENVCRIDIPVTPNYHLACKNCFQVVHCFYVDLHTTLQDLMYREGFIYCVVEASR